MIFPFILLLAYNDNSSVNNERTSQNAKLSNMKYHEPNYSASNGVGVIDFPMHWNFQYARDSFNLAKSTDQYYNDATYNVVYVDSHDYGPDCISTVRYNMGTASWAENMSLMFTFTVISSPGAAFIFDALSCGFSAAHTLWQRAQERSPAVIQSANNLFNICLFSLS